MRLSSACRDDPNDFFLLLFKKRMHNQQNRTRTYRSHRYPSLLFKSEITLRNSVRIVENKNRRLKAHIVLAKVLPILLLVPFKSHSWSRPRQNTVFAFILSTHLYLHLKCPPNRAMAQTQRMIQFWRAFEAQDPR